MKGGFVRKEFYLVFVPRKSLLCEKKLKVKIPFFPKIVLIFYASFTNFFFFLFKFWMWVFWLHKIFLWVSYKHYMSKTPNISLHK